MSCTIRGTSDDDFLREFLQFQGSASENGETIAIAQQEAKNQQSNIRANDARNISGEQSGTGQPVRGRSHGIQNDSAEQLFGSFNEHMVGQEDHQNRNSNVSPDTSYIDIGGSIRGEESGTSSSWMYQEGHERPVSLSARQGPFDEYVARAVSRAPLKRRVIHDIIRGPDTGGVSQIDLPGPHNRTAEFNFCIVFRHGRDHYHVVHDCSYSTDRCRCARLRELLRYRFVGRRRVIWGRDFSALHIAHTISYAEKNQRKIDYLECRGNVWIRGGETRLDAVRKMRDRGQEGLVAPRQTSPAVCDFVECGSAVHAHQCDSGNSEQANDGKNRQVQGGKGSQLEIWLRNHVSSPLSYIFQTSYFLDSRFKYWQLNKNCVQIPLKQINAKIQDMTILELERFAENAEVCIYNAPMGNVPEHYYDIEKSTEVLDVLLQFQFNHNEEAIRIFLQKLMKIVNRNNGKQNALVCISDPSAGKNFFFDTVLHFCLSVGYIANFNKYVSFPLQDCSNKRILCWNEPNCEPSAWDTIKMIFGGDTCPIRVKYSDDQQVTKTPVLVLSNKDIFPKDEAFNCRIFKIFWRPCSLLKQYNKKPYPLAFPQILRKYKCLPIIVNDKGCLDSDNESYNSDDSF